MKKDLPELLAPCKDMEALEAAIANGADAVYLGLDIFNARIRAKNFTTQELPSAVALAHAHKVKVYVTLNTQLYDKELPKMLVCGRLKIDVESKLVYMDGEKVVFSKKEFEGMISDSLAIA